MMNRRFSDQQLYHVRNRIPIRHVIENLLAIPSQTVQGVFRFRCPLCAGSHTAIKPKTNLSRCFQCEKNFNAIDLCMLVRHWNFVKSVDFLIKDKSSMSADEPQTICATHANHLEPKRQESKKPVAINEILSKLIDKGFEEGLMRAKQEPVSQQLASPAEIAELERIAHALSQIIQRFKSSHFNQE
jgi:hypothetical protein